MTIAHTGIKVPAAKYADVVAWYEAALTPLGYKKTIVLENGNVVGFSDNATGAADWWVVSSAACPEGVVPLEGPYVPNHTCFLAKGEFFFFFFYFLAVASYRGFFSNQFLLLSTIFPCELRCRLDTERISTNRTCG